MSIEAQEGVLKTSFKDKLKSKMGKKKLDEVQVGDENGHIQTGLEIRLPGCEEFVPISKFQYKRVYKDDMGGRLLIIVDEMAELSQPSGSKTAAGKEEDEQKGELVDLINSITRLGRNSGVHCLIATQRNDAKVIPGAIQNNSLSLRTRIRVRRNSSQVDNQNN